MRHERQRSRTQASLMFLVALDSSRCQPQAACLPLLCVWLLFMFQVTHAQMIDMCVFHQHFGCMVQMIEAHPQMHSVLAREQAKP